MKSTIDNLYSIFGVLENITEKFKLGLFPIRADTKISHKFLVEMTNFLQTIDWQFPFF